MDEYPPERDVVAPGILHEGDFAIRQITEFRAYPTGVIVSRQRTHLPHTACVSEWALVR
jgi:hypothetical protein